ncbi:zinc ribbon domain-containing protein [Streptomyces sp. NPDC008343]|uniref:zinc ribbon domain-containing protein n=1 Tax=Streptomyces sp. NPDC008343 TaxID=3364828 RepID=UPI0036E84E45
MPEYEAAKPGRYVQKIGRFEPTSQVCSACGIKNGPKPLSVREWTCGDCGTGHDRDHNAARRSALKQEITGARMGHEFIGMGPSPAPRTNRFG